MKIFKKMKNPPVLTEEQLYEMCLENQMWVECYDLNHNQIPVHKLSDKAFQVLVEWEWKYGS